MGCCGVAVFLALLLAGRKKGPPPPSERAADCTAVAPPPLRIRSAAAPHGLTGGGLWITSGAVWLEYRSGENFLNEEVIGVFWYPFFSLYSLHKRTKPFECRVIYLCII